MSDSSIFDYLWSLDAETEGLDDAARMDARMTRRRVKMLWYDVTWK